MKKIACLMTLYVFILLLDVKAADVKIGFENGAWIVEESSNLIIENDERIECQLMLNGKVIQKITKEDWKETETGVMYLFEAKNPGWYVLFGEENKFLGDAVYYHDEMLVTSYDTGYFRKEDWIMINQPTTLLFLEKGEVNAFDGLPYEIKDGWHIYRKDIVEDGKTITPLPQFKIWLDQIKPNVKMDIVSSSQVLQVSDTVFLLNDPLAKVQILKKDNSDDVFVPDDRWIKKENGYYCEYRLKEGENDLTELLSDVAGNLENETRIVYLDTKAPVIHLEQKEMIYLNGPFDVTFEDDFLDWKTSKITFDGTDVKEQCKENGNSFEYKVNQSGVLSFELVDLLGQTTILKQAFIYDDVLPTYHMEIKDAKLNVSLCEENLDVVNLTLRFNDEEILGVVDTQQVTYQLEKDGVYTLQGAIQDQAGNELIIDEKINANVNAPMIHCEYFEAPQFLKPQTITYAIDDIYLKYWQVNLYRNNILIFEEKGSNSESKTLVLDDSSYQDGQGLYRLDIMADDGLYQSHWTKEWVMDMSCAPIDVTINRAKGNQVSSLTILKPTLIQASCVEGSVYWELYEEDILIDSGEYGELTILPDGKMTSLHLFSKDIFGHKQSKTIYFNYESLLKMEQSENTMIDKNNNHVDSTEAMTWHSLSKVAGKKQTAFPWVIGGVLGATCLMGCIYLWRLRHQENEPNLLDAKTTALKD